MASTEHLVPPDPIDLVLQRANIGSQASENPQLEDLPAMPEPAIVELIYISDAGETYKATPEKARIVQVVGRKAARGQGYGHRAQQGR